MSMFGRILEDSHIDSYQCVCGEVLRFSHAAKQEAIEGEMAKHICKAPAGDSPATEVWPCVECGGTRFFRHCYPSCGAKGHVVTCRDCGVLNLAQTSSPADGMKITVSQPVYCEHCGTEGGLIIYGKCVDCLRAQR